MKSITLTSLLFAFISFATVQAKVYKNVRVGSYESIIDLKEYSGQPFFNVMRDEIYPEIEKQAPNRSRLSHLTGIKNGEGVEVILADDVTTYHVKYKADWEDKVERSGRSFGAVGFGKTKKYIADASYKHYLRTLEEILKNDDEEVAAFFYAILQIITNSDPSGINNLSLESKQVAADFIAIYIAEQYRRLTATEGRYLGRSHRWDDALVQVTLISAFHSGQDQMTMFYEGSFTDKVFNQSACLYKSNEQSDRRANTKKRAARLYDYWQFTVRSECPGRSGVNLTRRDFEKLGSSLTNLLVAKDSSFIVDADLDRDYKYNFFKAATKDLLDGSFDKEAMLFTDILVEAIMTTRNQANALTRSISN